MTKAGISQRTWKWTPLSLISDHWSMTVRTRKPKISDGDPELERKPNAPAAGRSGPDPGAGLAYPV